VALIRTEGLDIAVQTVEDRRFHRRLRLRH